MPSQADRASYLRSFTFGVEDSLSSTVGLLSGLAIASVARDTIFISGIILILVEAVSMSVGSFLSEHASEEYLRHREVSSKRSFFGALIMFFSYIIAGLVPLVPYLLFTTNDALALSVILSLGAMFLLGLAGARMARLSLFKNGLRTFMIGGIAIVIGVLAGIVLQQ